MLSLLVWLTQAKNLFCVFFFLVLSAIEVVLRLSPRICFAQRSWSGFVESWCHTNKSIEAVGKIPEKNALTEASNPNVRRGVSSRNEKRIQVVTLHTILPAYTLSRSGPKDRKSKQSSGVSTRRGSHSKLDFGSDILRTNSSMPASVSWSACFFFSCHDAYCLDRLITNPTMDLYSVSATRDFVHDTGCTDLASVWKQITELAGAQSTCASWVM